MSPRAARIRRAAGLAATLPALLLASCGRGSPDHEEILATVRAYDAAWNRRDSTAVAAALAPEYVYFSSTGRVVTRDGTLEFLASPQYRLEAAERSEVRVTHSSPQGAVVSSRWRGRGTWQGETFQDDQRCSLVLRRSDAGWQLLSEHCTQIRDTSGAELEPAAEPEPAADPAGSGSRTLPRTAEGPSSSTPMDPESSGRPGVALPPTAPFRDRCGMRNLAPDIFRQRLIVEGWYTVDVDREAVGRYLLEVAAHLGLRTYAEPIVFSPAGVGKEENQGFDAFVPLIDSGISAYVWTGPRFVSVLLYTCKGFDETAAVEFTRRWFGVTGEVASLSF